VYFEGHFDDTENGVKIRLNVDGMRVVFKMDNFNYNRFVESKIISNITCWNFSAVHAVKPYTTHIA